MLFVVKRDGTREEAEWGKIQERIKDVCEGLNVDSATVTLQVMKDILPENDEQKVFMTTSDIDQMIITRLGATKGSRDYKIAAVRFWVNDYHKKVNKFNKTFKGVGGVDGHFARVFSEKMRQMGNMSTGFMEAVAKYRDLCDEIIDYSRDNNFQMVGLETLKFSSLCGPRVLEAHGEWVRTPTETPQDMYMRLAVYFGSRQDDPPKRIKEIYDALSLHRISHASPTMSNSGTTTSTGSSCFLLKMDDNLKSISNTIENIMMIAKGGGGIGLHISDLRGNGTPIHSTGGVSRGIIGMLGVVDSIAKYIDQGGTKRPAAIGIHLAAWHSEIVNFLRLKDKTFAQKADHLHYTVLFNDLFFERLAQNTTWTLFNSPSQTIVPAGLADPNGITRDEPYPVALSSVSNEEFTKWYRFFEEHDIGVSGKISSLDLWNKVLEAKLSTGSYYIISIDNANRKNMHAGTLTGSNLCTEIYQSTTTDCPAVCNLGSIVLSNLQGETRQEQMADLRSRVQTLIRNLNVLIEHGDYATENPKEHNKGNRPLGIGIQGFSDRLVNLTSSSGRKGIPYESIEAQKDAFEILENMSYAFWDYSCSLAEIHGPFKDFENSKFAKGHLPHFHAKKVDPKLFGADEFNPWDENMKLKTTLDWDALSERVKKHGVYHSHGIAIMPTASTAIVTGSSPSNEPPQRLIYRHSTVSGTHDRLYMPMVNYLHRYGLWNEKVEHRISTDNSVQNINSFIPMFSSGAEGIAALAKAKNMGFDLDHFKRVFKTSYEVSNRKVCILNYLMQIFVDQGISMNMSLTNTDGAVIKLSKAIQFANMLGLSTLVYYLNFESRVKEAFLAKAECESCTA